MAGHSRRASEDTAERPAVPRDNGIPGAPDTQTFAPAQVPINAETCGVTVTPLSRDLTVSAPKRSTTFQPRNRKAQTHGLHARVSDALIAEREDFERRSLTDDGTDVPVRRASRHRYRARVHVQIEALSEALEQFGLFDKRGKLRVGWLQRLESMIGVAARLDASLGDERGARPVQTLSAAQWAALAAGTKEQP
jgi:hypothetical protein